MLLEDLVLIIIVIAIVAIAFARYDEKAKRNGDSHWEDFYMKYFV